MRKRLHLEAIQASDIREVLFAVIMKAISGTRIYYDSHEDYINQVLEYTNYNPLFFPRALKFLLTELLFLRFFDGVFCTDQFQFERFSKIWFGIKSLHLLRNFPPVTDTVKKDNYQEKDTLDLVYIGSVNKFRGVIETSLYVKRFNKKFSSQKRIRLTIFSQQNSIIDSIVDEFEIIFKKYVDFPILLEKLTAYDVGVCLWLPLKKFQRNLPLKNFDYMSVGLPVLTSNFPNIMEFVTKSNAGITIDPKSYKDFEKAIFVLFDPNKRKEFGENGREFVKRECNFEKESKTYISLLLHGNLQEEKFI